MSTQNYHFFVRGMHCASCVLLTENAVRDDARVINAHSNLASRSIDIEADFAGMTDEAVAEELTKRVQEHGYTFTTTKEVEPKKWNEFALAIVYAVGGIGLFFLLQSLGIVSLANTENVTYGTAFLIGIVASLSTCMAVVGGILLSLSASYAKAGSDKKPHVLFHLGRIVSFFILGGIIGALGSVFQFGLVGTFVIGLLSGFVMLILGINLLDIFHFTRLLQPVMPKFLSKRVLSLTKFNRTITPALVGVATFFLPCGFTQGMQLYTLTTGSFLKGGLTMLSFALGTVPVLGLISFTSFSIVNKKTSGIFFKAAGLIVIFFAVLIILDSCVVYGLIPPLFN